MNKQRAIYLLEEGFDEGENNIALVHGTSVETVLYLFNSDILPASQNQKYKGYIYFVPVKKAFKEYPFYKKIKKNNSLLEAEKLASFEAEINQKSSYLNKLIGEDFFMKLDGASEHKIKDFIDIIDYSMWDVKKLLKNYNRKNLCSFRNLLKICNELDRCNGVILGVHKNILENITEDSLKIDIEYKTYWLDEPDSIKIYMPKGLESKFIQYICPCGEKEEDLIYDYINNNLK